MINKQFISELSDKVASVLPDGLGELKQDTKDNVCSVVQATFEKFNLVTREEFDVQAKVLARTREQLSDLEQQIAALEQALKSQSQS